MGLDIAWEWLAFAVKWAHVVAGVAWIGTSFYFIALDLGLRTASDMPKGVRGEEWQVHGGGFYHVRKYMIAPPGMPEHLTWFKWESYATWLTGAALMGVLYYAGAELYLIDHEKLPLPVWGAIAISVGSLAIGWVVYDRLCKSPLGRNDITLMLALYGLIVVMGWAYAQVFTGRAALLHLGAFTATIMTANVAHIIMPHQRKSVAELMAGREPPAHLGALAKQRSLHNNYLTLPVIFLMLSNHYPLAFASTYNWLIAALVFLLGVLIRYYFNTYHAHKGVKLWPWGASVALLAVMAWLSTLSPPAPSDDFDIEEARAASASPYLAHADFEEAYDIVLARCAMCHAAAPAWDGVPVAPKAVLLETPAQVAQHARAIYLQSAVTRAMPPGNITYLEPEERAVLRRWYEQAGR
ncbi:MAG: urate hydroxylase PuuD [Pseudomonadota bacterium]